MWTDPNCLPHAPPLPPAHYDGTTRNAAGAVVQFVYGDDGMDPVLMEAGDGTPLDLGRTLSKVGLPASARSCALHSILCLHPLQTHKPKP